MYLVGAPHRCKTDAQILLGTCITERQRLVTDAEVLQEILQRSAAIDRREAIQPAFDALLGVVDHVHPIDVVTIQRAKAIVLERKSLSAREAVHVAVMEQHGIDQIMTFDAGFDEVPGILRLKA